MTTNVRVMVLAGNGINCEMETAHACRMAGADEVNIVYLWDLASGKARLEGYPLLCCPGGFLDGDDLGSARASTIRLRHTVFDGQSLLDQIRHHVDGGGLVMGICNGFQLMVKLGLLPALDGAVGTPQVTLTTNDSGRFEDRWVTLKADPESPCVFTRGMEFIELPIRHGEGKIVGNETVLQQIRANHQAPLVYVDPETKENTEIYPMNPNGSPAGIAALSDTTGRLFGLMPHPEAFLHRTNHPRWTREQRPDEGDGLQFFKNAVDYIRTQF